MSEVAQPFALPCFSFKNFCPTFRLKRVVKRENVPSRESNPILNDKKFVDLRQRDVSNEKVNEVPDTERVHK